eukprot:TRINITY_DN420_c0_g1_i1.p1 TRINITY_DN420_c0_g1~~TRINITY_DN420_c0_g1_i1.p1  ORF type:complete len:389 (-),score=67.58 TRINITY_DN420_c0_g1_i1:61-1227(-)
MAQALNAPIKRISLSNLMVPSSPPHERSNSFSSGTGSMPSLSSLRSLASSTRSYDDESNIHSSITVTVVFPSGENHELKISTGQTVQDVKKILEVKHQVPCRASSLFYDGVIMLDPLSINDYPKIMREQGATLTLKISNEETCNTNPPINNANPSSDGLLDEKNSIKGSGNNNIPNGNHAEKRPKKSVVEDSSSDSEDGWNEEYVRTPPKLHRSIPSIDITHGIPVHSISPPPHIHNQVISDATDITPQNTSPSSNTTPLIGSPTLESYSNLNSVNLSPTLGNSVLRTPTPTFSPLSSYSSSSSLTVAVSDHALTLDSSRSLPDTRRTSGISVNFYDPASTHPNSNNSHNPAHTSIDIKYNNDDDDEDSIPNIQTLDNKKPWRVCWII